jgi:NAD-dependent dihydropyrimidine dehydrogenase PreA subunit
MFNGSVVKSAVWGTYPQTMDMAGGNIVTILSIPQNNEGLGYALRNINANHVAMMTHRNAMQTCALSCTFEQAGEFEMGMKPRKAIYIYHPQVVPLLYTIDFDSCIKCGLCVTACGEKKAIDLEMKDELRKVKVGTVILATGYDIFPVEKKREWGYQQFDNVVTSLEFERLICASGPTAGHLIRPSDGQTPKRVAFVLCAGSRDNTGIGNRTVHGSAVCTHSSTPTRLSKKYLVQPPTSSTWIFGHLGRCTKSSTTESKMKGRSSSEGELRIFSKILPRRTSTFMHRIP